MESSRAPIIYASEADSSIFFHWTPIENAEEYQLEITDERTLKKTLIRTHETNFFLTKLDNGTRYTCQITVVTLNDELIQPFIPFTTKPRWRQQLSRISVQYTSNPGEMFLQWSSNPTHFGYRIQRCDIGSDVGHKTIARIPDNTITNHFDYTDCVRQRKSCQGHFYCILHQDSNWSSGLGYLSVKVFCMDINQGI